MKSRKWDDKDKKQKLWFWDLDFAEFLFFCNRISWNFGCFASPALQHHEFLFTSSVHRRSALTLLMKMFGQEKVFGMDLLVLKNQVVALVMNIYAWIVSTFVPESFRSKNKVPPSDSICCVSIQGPGGLDQFKVEELAETKVTVGSNLKDMGLYPPFATIDYKRPLEDQFDPSLVLVETDFFSINYADVCIRWGLYESALRFVGFPIVPGFDFSGRVVWAGSKSGFKRGDVVFGFTLFGSYSRRILVPSRQIRVSPRLRNMPGTPAIDQALLAGVPAAAATALHAIALARAWPEPLRTKNKSVLIHSAAGGVGSQLVTMCKLVGLGPIVAVVGLSHKVQYCKDLGADFVIDKSKENLWKVADRISPDGFAAVFDANGISTLQDSYDHTARCGSLVVYGFHSNLPKASTLLSPLAWFNMVKDVFRMPRFDPMELTLESRNVAGFNLSFFEKEHEMIDQYLNQITTWLGEGKINPSPVTSFSLDEVGKAHELIQSGRSQGKLVVNAVVKDKNA